MAAVAKMAAAAKLAEERIRLDVGDDISVEDEVIPFQTHTLHGDMFIYMPNDDFCTCSFSKRFLPIHNLNGTRFVCFHRMWALVTQPRVRRLIPYLSIAGPADERQSETQRPLL